jgi:hypothetical protein
MASISVPLDSDGFLRRECPACEQQFKWRASGPDDEVEHVDQYFCPLCGRPAGPDAWWTHEQLENAKAAIVPEALQAVQDALGQAFKGNRSVSFKPATDLGAAPVPKPLHEPDDMVIVEPPCHVSEPVKVPDDAPSPYYCLVCGSPFAA